MLVLYMYLFNILYQEIHIKANFHLKICFGLKLIIPEFLAFWPPCIEEANPVSRRGKTITGFPWLISLFVNIGTIEYKIYPDSSLKFL